MQLAKAEGSFQSLRKVVLWSYCMTRGIYGYPVLQNGRRLKQSLESGPV